MAELFKNLFTAGQDICQFNMISAVQKQYHDKFMLMYNSSCTALLEKKELFLKIELVNSNSYKGEKNLK